MKLFFPIIKLQNAQEGFTVIEMLLVMAIFAVLVALGTVNLFSFQHTSQITTSVNSFIADIKEQQTKAMVGDTEGRTANANYGLNFATTRYTLYHGTFSSTDSANFVVTLPNTLQVTTTFPNSQLVFEAGTGDIVGYASTSASITLRDTVTAAQKVLNLNRYGVITSVN